MNTSNATKLNNDAASYIRSQQYHRAIWMLDRAMIQLARCPSSPSCLLRHFNDDKTHHRKRSGQHFNMTTADEGMETFTEPVELHCSHFADENTVKIFIYYNLGIAHSRLGNEEDALCYFIKAKTQNDVVKSLSSFKKSFHEFHEDAVFALLHNLGRSSFRCNRHDDSLRFYNAALELARQNPSKYYFHHALTLNNVGVVRLASKNSNDRDTDDSIMSLFLDALSILENISRSQSSTSEILSFQATVFNNLGRIILIRKKYDEAKKMFQTSYFIRTKLYDKLHCNVITVLLNIAEAEYGLGNLDEAGRLYSKFVDTSLSTDIERQRVPQALKRLGEIHRQKGEYRKAMETYIQALKSYKLVQVEEENLEIISILNEIGGICHELNDFNKALCAYQEALRLSRQIDSNHPDLAITLINIGYLFQQQTKYDQALEHYNEAMTILRMCPKTEKIQLQMACVLSGIGLINDQRNKYWEATAAFEEALEIRMEIQGKDHFDVSCTLNAIGLIYFKQGSLDLAVCNFKDSLDIRLKQESPNSADISIVLFNIAAVYLELGETDMAIDYYTQTLQHEKDANSDNKTDKLATLKCLGQIHLSQGDLDEALVYYNEAVAVLLQMLDNSPNAEVATLLSSIGNIYLHKGEIEKAREAYVEALRINNSEGVDDLSNIVSDGIKIHDVMKKSCQSAPAA